MNQQEASMERWNRSPIRAISLAAIIAASACPAVRAVDGAVAAPAAAESCAESLILAAAKTNVAKNFNDAPESGGQCAYGVRTSLQLSGVGGITGGIGNAIDYLKSLPPYGFVATGALDPNTAVPGSVIVFQGPDSASYLATGKYGTPAGDWLGHVTIKGDDGYYYTDARTVEPAVGWENGADVEDVRTVAGIFVPNAALTAQYASACPAPPPAPGPSVANTDDRIAGHRQASAAVQQFRDFSKMDPGSPDRLAAFQGLLAAIREAAPYDAEGRLSQMLAQAISGDAALRSAYDAYVKSLGAPDCKTRQLTTSVDHSLCIDSLGIKGQDFAGSTPINAAKACADTFDYQSCMSGR
jgi:hypothetical protein